MFMNSRTQNESQYMVLTKTLWQRRKRKEKKGEWNQMYSYQDNSNLVDTNYVCALTRKQHKAVVKQVTLF